VSFICNVGQVDGSSRWKWKGGYQRENSKGWLDNFGKVTNLNVISQVTLDSCEEECSKNAKCVGYTYITSRSRCDLKDESGIAGGLKEIDGLVAGKKVNRKGCSCTDYVNKNGFGQCKKSHPKQFYNEVSCYVNLPTTCTDIIQSSTDRGKWLSHEACLIDGSNPDPQCPAPIKEDMLGPYFVPNTDLPLFGPIAPNNEVNLYVEGVVYNSSCSPVPGAKVEVWHASPHKGDAYYTCRPKPLDCFGRECRDDDCAKRCLVGLCRPQQSCARDGELDQSDVWGNHTLTQKLWYRGKGKTDMDGKYWYKTSFPGTYNVRRIPHIHYKVTYPERKEVVTQLYFEGKIPEGFNQDKTRPNQVKEVVPCTVAGKNVECVTFHIYPEDAALKWTSCPL